MILTKFESVLMFKMGKELWGKILYPVHTFLLDDLLIDTGSISAKAHFLPEIKKFNITQIINTHAHEDHIGNNTILQEMLNIPIYCHPKAQDSIEDPSKINFHSYERFFWGIPQGSKTTPTQNEIFTTNHTLQIIHTPGHSPGHICLYEPKNKWIFTGDLYLGTKMTYLRRNEHFNLQLASLKRLIHLDIEIIFCSFRGLVTNAGQKLKKKINYMEKLQKDTIKLFRRGDTPKLIRKKLLGREDIMHFVTRGDYSKQNLINTILQEHFEKE